MKKRYIILIVLAIILLVVAGKACSYVGKAADVVAKEIDPAYLLQKYEWFKNAAAQLNKKRADIKVYSSRITSMTADYADVHRKDWDRTDKEQMSLWRNEVAGVRAGYNSLAAEYNAQMAKVNWRFCNVGQLPKGATEPLPRDYAPYE